MTEATEGEVPVIWLLGKTQSGKTSIVAEITGEDRAEVGSGFAPKTRTARLHDFPAEAPVLRFLDTRGLGDAADYDPRDDIAFAAKAAHVILAVVRADDTHVGEIVAVARKARAKHPNWPVIVAQTTLHNLYPKNTAHLQPYPFDGSDADFARPDVPRPLLRALEAQRRAFADLPGKGKVLFVPLDFTQPEHGLPPADYGADALFAALEAVGGEAIAGLAAARRGARDARARTHLVLPWAFAAAAANAVPAPVVGGIASAGMQAMLVRALARRYGLVADRDLWVEFASAMGSGFALSFGGGWAVQQVLKLGLGWGTAATAAWTFAITWGIGEAAIYYFGERAADRTPDRAEMQGRYKKGFDLAKAEYAKRKSQGKA